MTPLEKQQLDNCSSLFNKSFRQTEFLYNLLNKDLNKLLALEVLMRMNHIWYCPGSISEVNGILYGT